MTEEIKDRYNGAKPASLLKRILVFTLGCFMVPVLIIVTIAGFIIDHILKTFTKIK